MPRGVLLDEMHGLAAARRLEERFRDAGLEVRRASEVRPPSRDSSLLNYALSHDLVLVTRDIRDFLRLNEQWTALRDWGVLSQPHHGILILLGRLFDSEWADLVADLLIHPNGQSLEDQVLLWHAAKGQWESDHPYSHQRRRPVAL